jgi:hypothetical protein
LFNVRDDPGEDRNLALLPEYRGELERLRAKYARATAPGSGNAPAH